MKRILLASTMLVAGAGMAAADVTISGYGRFGLQYNSNVGAGFSKTVIDSRLRLNITGTMETDGGVTFGGRLRLQYDQGDDPANMTFNTAQYFVSYEGLTVYVGNVETPWDNVALLWNSEMGFQDSSVGDPYNGYFGYGNFKGNNPGWQYPPDAVGVSASYSVGDLNIWAAYVNPDQSVKDLPGWADKEISLSVDYTTGPFTVAAAYIGNTAGWKDDNVGFIGAAYNFGDGNVGLNYINYDYSVGPSDHQITLYGNYTFGATTVRAVVSDWDFAGNKTAYGIGADYDLGNGARISGTYQRDHWGDKFADLGVRFDF